MIRLTRSSVFLLASSSVFVFSPLAAQETASDPDRAESAIDETPENVIVVTGIRASLQGAVRQKENSDQIKDVIDAEDVGKLPDTNVAEALQRVTGVQINRSQGEGSEVSVRGFSQNRIEVDGQTQVGSTADGNVAFETIPSEAFSSIEVIKTPAADEIEGALGAIVRLNTREPLDNGGKTILSFKGEAQYSDRAEKWTPNFSILASKGFTLGDAGEIGLLLSYTRKHRKLRQDFYDIRGYEAVGGFGLDLDGDGVANEQVDRENGIITDLQDGAYVPLQTLFRAQEQDRKLDNLTFAIQAKLDDSFEAYVKGSYSKNRNDDDQYQAIARLNNGVRPDGQGGFLIADQYSDIDNLVISDNRTVQRAFLGNYRGNNNRPNGIGFGLSGASNPPQQDVFTIQAGLIWELTDRLTTEVQVSMGDGKRFQSYINTTSGISGLDRPFFFYDFTTGNDIPTFIPLASEVDGELVTGFDEAAQFDLSDPSIYTFNNIILNEDYDKTQETALRIDFDYDLDLGFLTSLEFGGRISNISGNRYRFRARDAQGDADGTFGDQPFTDLIEQQPGLIVGLPYDNFLEGATGDYPDFFLVPDPSFLRPNIDQIFTDNNIDLTLDESFGYRAERDTMAAYIKANFATELGTIPLFGNVGVRYVKTERVSTGPAPSGVQGDIQLNVETASFDYSNWLPSLNLVIEPFDRTYARFGAARSMARPDLEDASPLLIVSDSFDRARGGNPLLRPQVVNQLDLSLEKYWGDSNLLALAFFYKRFEERIEDGIRSECLPIANDQPADTTPGPDFDSCLVGQDLVRAEVPINVGGATVKGFEVNFQQSFDFLPSPLDGFGMVANYTYVDAGFGSTSATGAQLPVQDLSENSYNLIGYYEKYGFSARVAYNWRDEFYDERTDTNQASFRKAYGQLDASIGFDITRQVSLNFEAINILNEPEEAYQELFERPLSYRINDRRFVIGLRVRN